MGDINVASNGNKLRSNKGNRLWRHNASRCPNNCYAALGEFLVALPVYATVSKSRRL